MSLNPIPPAHDLAAAYKAYVWDAKHNLYGYPSDAYPEFRWMHSLEQRFAWLRQHAATEAAPYLFQEMIQWGGSQNGVLQKIEDGAHEVCFSHAMQAVIQSLPNPSAAISAALEIPGLGLTYASKLLRFLDPKSYGALDSRIRKSLHSHHQWKDSEGTEVKIYDGNTPSMVQGYCLYLDELRQLRATMLAANVLCPNSSLNSTNAWRLADVELALFQYLA